MRLTLLALLFLVTSCNNNDDSTPKVIVAQDGSFIEVNGSRQKLDVTGGNYMKSCSHDAILEAYVSRIELSGESVNLGGLTFDAPFIVSVVTSGQDAREGVYQTQAVMANPLVSEGNAIIIVGGYIGLNGTVTIESIGDNFGYRFNELSFYSGPDEPVEFIATGQIICE